MHFRKICLAGVGLLGGSFGLAVRRRRLADTVAGYVRRPASVAECRRAGAVDFATCDLQAAVQGAELLVLCTPLGQMLPITRRLLPDLKPGAIVTDVGSVKGRVVSELERLVQKAGGVFVGSHPMAGSERTGVAAAQADLFEGAACVVTPTSRTPRVALRKVEKLWTALGARVQRLTPRAHDVAVSRTSHLTYVVAAVLARLVLGPNGPAAQRALCANGFRDTTRVASGSPEMWRDIAVTNHVELRRALKAYQRELAGLEHLLRSKNGRLLEDYFGEAKSRRDEWIAGGSLKS